MGNTDTKLPDDPDHFVADLIQELKAPKDKRKPTYLYLLPPDLLRLLSRYLIFTLEKPGAPARRDSLHDLPHRSPAPITFGDVRPYFEHACRKFIFQPQFDIERMKPQLRAIVKTYLIPRDDSPICLFNTTPLGPPEDFIYITAHGIYAAQLSCPANIQRSVYISWYRFLQLQIVCEKGGKRLRLGPHIFTHSMLNMEILRDCFCKLQTHLALKIEESKLPPPPVIPLTVSERVLTVAYSVHSHFVYCYPAIPRPQLSAALKACHLDPTENILVAFAHPTPPHRSWLVLTATHVIWNGNDSIESIPLSHIMEDKVSKEYPFALFVTKFGRPAWISLARNREEGNFLSELRDAFKVRKQPSAPTPIAA